MKPVRWYEGPLAAFALSTVGDVDGDVDQVRITATAVVAVWAGGEKRRAYVHTVGETGQPPALALEATVLDLVRALAEGYPIVAYDVARSLAVLESECRRNGALTLVGPADEAPAAICTKVMDRAVRGAARDAAGPRSMADTYSWWGHPIDDQADATTIALASAKVALEIAARYRHVVGADLGELQERQRAWHNSQCRARASRLTRMANRAGQGDEKLRLLAQAERAEAEARHWPLLVPAGQEALA